MGYKRADKRKYHYIYKTICLVTGKWYIGLHSTDDLNDGYMGSGTYLANSIRKHGRENHVFEILEYHESRDAVKLREAELVTWVEVNLAECMNLIPGGNAGDSWRACNAKLTVEQRREISKAGNRAFKAKFENPDYAANWSIRSSAQNKASYDNGRVPVGWSQSAHKAASSVETNAKRSKTMKQYVGERNSQHGTCWITDGKENKKVKASPLELPEGWRRGRIISP